MEDQRARLALWGSGSLAVALVHNRLWATLNLEFFTLISRSLGRNPFAGSPLDGSYLLTNLLPVGVARLLGQTEAHEYARLHLVVLVLGLVAVVAATYRRFGYAPARLLTVLLAAAPATTVGMEWLGQPDAFTLPLALGVVVSRRRTTTATLALLLGLTHAEQGAVIAFAAMCARLAVDEEGADLRGPRAWAAALLPTLGGVAAGRVVTEAYLRLNDIVITTPRTAFFDRGVREFARLHGEAGGWLVYALWGPLWLGIAFVLVQLRRRPDSFESGARQGWAVLALGSFPALVAMLATFDETRVFSMTSAPLLVAAAVLGSAIAVELPQLPRRAAVALGTAALLLVPAVFTVDGVHRSWDFPAREFARFLIDGTHPGELVEWLNEPLDFEIAAS